jgi:GNAT superfamily N-acetyltransferase
MAASVSRKEARAMEGPRGLRDGELEPLRQLTSVVFRPTMVDQYPHLFCEENFANLRVMWDGDRCVAHVGMATRRATLFGCAVQVGCIGAVGTLPEYRGQGLASRCFDDAVDKAYRDGTDYLLVSGDRDLYRRRGCLPVGNDEVFSLPADAAMPPVLAAAEQRLPVTINPLTDADLPLVMDCYRREPVRFSRTPEDYRRALRCGVVMNRPAEFLIVREEGAFRGYLIVGQRGENVRAVEFAGDRRAILAALPAVYRRYVAHNLGWQVSHHDALFRDLCAAAGLPGTSVGVPGTVKLVNFPQLMERMRAYWEEVLGTRAATCLAFAQHGDEYVIRFGTDELVLNRDDATRLLFGTIDGAQAQRLPGCGELTEALGKILPLPCLWYGMNYV